MKVIEIGLPLLDVRASWYCNLLFKRGTVTINYWRVACIDTKFVESGDRVGILKVLTKSKLCQEGAC